MPRSYVGDEQYAPPQQDGRFPRLTGFEKGEYVRLHIPPAYETIGGVRQPVTPMWTEWVHRIAAPAPDPSTGRYSKIDKPKFGGGTRRDWNTDHIRSRICMGDPAVLERDEIDPENCLACLAAKDGYRDMKPERRYAVEVVRLKCARNNRSSKLASPPGAEVLVWGLSSRMYTKLMTYLTEEITGYLEETLPEGRAMPDPVMFRHVDVLLQCDKEQYGGTLEFKTPKRCSVSRAFPEVLELVRALWKDKDNRATEADLRAACGRDGDLDYMAEDVEECRRRWDEALGRARKDPTAGRAMGGDAYDEEDEDLEEGLGDLLDEDDAPRQRPAGRQSPAAADEDALDEGDPFAEESELADHPGGADEFADEAPRRAAAAARNGNGGGGRNAGARAAAARPAPPADDDDPFADEADQAAKDPTPARRASAAGSGRPAGTKPAAARTRPAAAPRSEPAAAPEDPFGDDDDETAAAPARPAAAAAAEPDEFESILDEADDLTEV